MTTKVVFTMKLEPDLRDLFMAEAAAADRPAAQIIREFMRGYIEQRRQERSYDAYLQQKVDASRQSMNAGRGRTNDEVESAFAARRNRVKQTTDDADYLDTGSRAG